MTWKERAKKKAAPEGRGNVLVDIEIPRVHDYPFGEAVTIARFPWEKRHQAISLGKAILAEERPAAVRVYVRVKRKGQYGPDWWETKTLYTGSSW